jgi:uncharacterized membrane protein
MTPTYIQAGAIVVLLFILVISLAQFRHHFVKWSMKGGLVGLFFGVLLTLILEGFLLVSGQTALTTVLKWKNPPKPFSTALDRGKEKLTEVLDLSEIDDNSKDVLTSMQSLNPDEIRKIKAIICEP